MADVIAAESQGQHRLAMSQMRGHFSSFIEELRRDMIHFASLIELENDFSEEDVEFADRKELVDRTESTLKQVNELISSFRLGNVIKKGIPVAIIGPPNAGKSTLLNALLKEERAIVSDVPGTTRDSIEDTMVMDGMLFRFIDTAGIRETQDDIERMGIERSFQQLEKAKVILYLTPIREEHIDIVREVKSLNIRSDQQLIVLLNKTDEFHSCHAFDVEEAVSTLLGRAPVIALSAKMGHGMDRLKAEIVKGFSNLGATDLVVTNLRHVEELEKCRLSLEAVLSGLELGIPSDLIALDLRHALNALGEITGKISTDDLLDNIFRNFCIGK